MEFLLRSLVRLGLMFRTETASGLSLDLKRYGASRVFIGTLAGETGFSFVLKFVLLIAHGESVSCTINGFFSCAAFF
jgi:hypothetical protein